MLSYQMWSRNNAPHASLLRSASQVPDASRHHWTVLLPIALWCLLKPFLEKILHVQSLQPKPWLCPARRNVEADVGHSSKQKRWLGTVHPALPLLLLLRSSKHVDVRPQVRKRSNLSGSVLLTKYSRLHHFEYSHHPQHGASMLHYSYCNSE